MIELYVLYSEMFQFKNTDGTVNIYYKVYCKLEDSKRVGWVYAKREYQTGDYITVQLSPLKSKNQSLTGRIAVSEFSI